MILLYVADKFMLLCKKNVRYSTLHVDTVSRRVTEFELLRLLFRKVFRTMVIRLDYTLRAREKVNRKRKGQCH